MTVATNVDNEADGFDDAWGDDPSPSTKAEEATTHTDDDFEVEAPASQDADEVQDSGDDKGGDEPSDVARLREELEKESQRVRSAEGRYSKFSSELEGMRQKVAELEAKLSAKDKPATADAPADDDETDEDLDPEFAETINKRVNKHVTKAVSVVDERLAKLEKDREDEAQRRQQEAEAAAYQQWEESVRKEVPDYDDIMDKRVDELYAWVDAQSPALKRAYNLVIENGTPDEAADMLKAFKAAKSENSQQRDVQRKADAAAAVPSRRGTAIPRDKNSKASKDDFDEAWRD